MKIHLGSKYLIEPLRIMYLRGDTNYTHIILTDGEILFSSTNLKKLEDRLTQYGFFRAHKSHLVNLKKIKTVEKVKKKVTLVMSDGLKLNLSRRKKLPLEFKI
ncbi:MAG: LytTR family transcriptional regulator DNA-binding domain-containing protein [Leadbetterella sp.]